VTDVLRRENGAALVHEADSADAAWWRRAVIYQIYPRSWSDSDGDGVGDLPGITARLPYLQELGVDAVWLSPFYVSPHADAGYDVADYRDIDPLFGTLADAQAMVDAAHGLGLKVIVDLVPNHTSDEHEWFRAALTSDPGSAERERYLFRDGQGDAGERPPNNWDSVFGGAAWTPVDDGRLGPTGKKQWYLHLFDTKQPDLNWENAEVRAEFEAILRFWLDRGVDGFRVDVAHGLIKAPGLPDWTEPLHLLGDPDATTRKQRVDEQGNVLRAPMWDQDGVHEVYRAWRRVLDAYNPPAPDDEAADGDKDRILCAEAWVEEPERTARYVRPDEMQQAFNFEFLLSPWRAQDLRAVIEHSFAANDAVGAPTTWVLSNHDVVRHATRLGLPVGAGRPNGIGIGDPQPDAELGLRRARAATTLMLALPGSAYLYQGEELGLPGHTTMPDEYRQDPTWERSGHAERGRDGCRVPMPWEADQPSYGFGPSGRTWLPQPESYGKLAVDQQRGVEGSTLELYRSLLATRRELGLGTGAMAWLEGYGDDVVALANDSAQRVGVIANLGATPVGLPAGAQVLLASDDLTEDGAVPTDTTVWFRL
jgi:alpha-glucosidase